MMRARYLLRFDDICPTMNWRVWDAVETALQKYRVRPLLAVIPSNRDPAMKIDPPAHDFWARCREWQSRGWSIGLHGFEHRYVTRNAGVLRTKPQSEFAGLTIDEQMRKLREGLSIFAKAGVQADAWVAPSHSFDYATVTALATLGIRVISDGPWRLPHTDALGIMWVPQQLARFDRRSFGVWTVCLHHNTWTEAGQRRMLDDIERFAPRCTSMDEIVCEFRGRRKSPMDSVTAGWDQLHGRSMMAMSQTLRRFSGRA